MGTLENPGKFDCMAKIRPGEPFFVLRAQDVLAPHLVFDWAYMLAKRGGNEEKVKEADACACAMLKWQREHGAKVPD